MAQPKTNQGRNSDNTAALTTEEAGSGGQTSEQVAREASPIDETEHNPLLRVATGVSYLTLVCHEDTWTFVATEAFGIWRTGWLMSSPAGFWSNTGAEPTYREAGAFTVDPNLPRGRISKLGDGMMRIKLSGHNLVRVLDSLYAGATSGDVVHTARCTTLYEKFASFVRLIDPATASGQTTGIEHRIDDSVNERHVRRNAAES